MNGQLIQQSVEYFTDEFISSFTICQTTDHSVYEFNEHFKLISWPLKYVVLGTINRIYINMLSLNKSVIKEHNT